MYFSIFVMHRPSSTLLMLVSSRESAGESVLYWCTIPTDRMDCSNKNTTIMGMTAGTERTDDVPLRTHSRFCPFVERSAMFLFLLPSLL